MKPWLLVLAFAAAVFGVSASHLFAVPNDNLLAICIFQPNTSSGHVSLIHQKGLEKLCSASPRDVLILADQDAQPGEACDWSAWGDYFCPNYNLAMGTASIPDAPHLVFGMAAFIGLAFYGWGGRRRSPPTPE